MVCWQGLHCSLIYEHLETNHRIKISASGGSTGDTEGTPPSWPAGNLGGNIFIDLTVQLSCFVTIYIIIWANTQLNLILVFRHLWYAMFEV